MLEKRRKTSVWQGLKIALCAMATFFCCAGLCALQPKDAFSSRAETAVTLHDMTEVSITSEGKQHFTLYFSQTLGSVKKVGQEQSETIKNYVFINGKSVADINTNGVDKYGAAVSPAVEINIWDTGVGYYGLHFYINNNLSADYKLKLDDSDVLEIKTGFSSEGVTTTQDLKAIYQHSTNSWVQNGAQVNTSTIYVQSMTPVSKMEGKQHFTLYFNQSLGTVQKVGQELSDAVQNYVYINGKTVADINANGKDSAGNALTNGVEVNIWNQADTSHFGLHFFINDNLSTDYKLKLSGKDSLEIKDGFSLEGVSVTRNLKATYFSNIGDWKKYGDVIDADPVSVISASAPYHWVEQNLWFFYVRFENNPSSKGYDFLEYSEILDNITYNGQSFTSLRNTFGNDSVYLRLQKGTDMELPYEDYLLYIHMTDPVMNAYPLADGSTLTFKKYMMLPSLATVKEDITYSYDSAEACWIADRDGETQYTDVKPVEVSLAMEETWNTYFVVYFDKDVCYRYMPLVNTSTEFLEGLTKNYDQTGIYYSSAALQALVYDGIRESVLDYMYFNGKTIRELCQADNVVGENSSISINYCGAETLDPKAIQISFNSNGVNAFDMSKENVLIIKKGFKTPLHGEVQDDYTIVVGKSVTCTPSASLDPSNPPIPGSSDSTSVQQSDNSSNSTENVGGCTGCGAQTQMILPMVLMTAFVTFTVRRRRNGEE